jgi:pimeloyl-ACP methyl ester carboxylesterase
MNQTPRLGSDSGRQALSDAVPLYIPAGGHTLFAWLHVPRSQRNLGLGLVICNPFGYEAICSHRSIRAFAEAAVAAGVPVLQFDYAGTGDSSDLDPLADQVEIWRDNCIEAVRELQRRTGVPKVCLLGFRLGALIAVLAARECRPSVVGLALVSPVINGRRYLRELRTTRLAATLGAESDESGRGLANETATPLPEGSIEAGGFVMHPATVSKLLTLDLASTSSALEGEVLVVDGDSLPVSKRWADSLATMGSRVTYNALPGLVQMLMTAPQFAKVPELMIGTTTRWLASQIRTTPQVSIATAPEDTEPTALASRPEAEDDPVLQIEGLRERPMFFGPGEAKACGGVGQCRCRLPCGRERDVCVVRAPVGKARLRRSANGLGGHR